MLSTLFCNGTGCLPMMPTAAWADEGGVSYINEAGEEATQAGCVSLTEKGFENLVYGGEAWYVADKDITATSSFLVIGTVNLILCDGVTVELKNGLSINGDNENPATLNIYRQQGGTGTLEVVSTNYSDAGIGNNSGKADTVSNLNIYGGSITATGAWFPAMSSSQNFCGAGIGTAANHRYNNTMNVSIYGGTVTAKAGGSGAAAIGKGTNAIGTVNVTIAKCEDHKWEYTHENDAEHHSKKCSLCGFQGGERNSQL